ncbi:RecName: Full=Inositol monophosphatase 2; AltName: Full=Inositol-1(or 4)-monophosphatase 2; Short=IMPase 2; Short=IMP 2 [Ectocarpus siliculosus]|uniref:Inositol-1-monophosphatase n=1 Tax=Ectocarpus siliculosus TaxID=2880 RepID=D7FZS0_ECTSI|nr:RecName: Full=Inositol monophosphatase 2; AltName: Full=Inositol-1(or 4)-monophosphatase 2; Short=IMPase 2; Short=IMP 2 [Ectocarpus siliculosus]|eukprot:CBJ32877.1 RecName: Full=Inositol monophosphatase 2; AltName: Full=Inositol-1(or 4)-monophosphatase 2; Short=IMPase 2; Short=IMP 2 [Ectocarpus siliculosus]
MDASCYKEALASAKAAALAAGENCSSCLFRRQTKPLQRSRPNDRSPDHQFMGEESTFEEAGGGEAVDADIIGTSPTWVIDPLDGTTNFVHGYPLFCVSIALAVDGVPVIGVVYHPVSGDLYTACRGEGAFLNGVKVEVRPAQGLGDALVVNNIGPARDEAFIATTLGRLAELLRRNVQAIRMSGSAALNMCHVACGKLDCYYEDGYGGPWDVAAGLVIVREAKGVVRDLRNSEFVLRPGKGRVVCGNERVVNEVCAALEAADNRGGSPS